MALVEGRRAGPQAVGGNNSACQLCEGAPSGDADQVFAALRRVMFPTQHSSSAYFPLFQLSVSIV